MKFCFKVSISIVSDSCKEVFNHEALVNDGSSITPAEVVITFLKKLLLRIIFFNLSPTHNDFSSRKRILSVKQRVLLVAERVLSSIERVLFDAERVLSFIKRVLFVAERVLFFMERVLFVAERVLSFIERVLFVAERVLSFIERVLLVTERVLYFC